MSRLMLFWILNIFMIEFGVAEVADDVPVDPDASSGRYVELEEGKSAFEETWVLPGVDWSKFDKIYLWEATWEYRDVGPAQRTGSAMLNSRKREFGITEEGREKFEEVVSEAFVKELQKGKRFTVVDEIGPNTLLLRGAILDIVSNVPPEMTGRSDVYLATIGEATFAMELINAETGDVLALVSERRKMETPGGRIDQFSARTSSATIISDVRRWAGNAARKLRGELDKAMKGR